MAVEAGERLTFSFDFMLNDVTDGSGFRADARFFTPANNFVGETVQFLSAANYAPGVWHNFTTTAVVPAGAAIGDVRFSTFFGPFTGGQILIDNVQLLRNLAIPGDYNVDGRVDAADYVVWRNTLGQTVVAGGGADGNRDGMINQEDYVVWRAAFGNSAANPQNAVNNLPEPADWILFMTSAVVSLRCIRRGQSVLVRSSSAG
jgi:hypothetical protein